MRVLLFLFLQCLRPVPGDDSLLVSKRWSALLDKFCIVTELGLFLSENRCILLEAELLRLMPSFLSEITPLVSFVTELGLFLSENRCIFLAVELLRLMP